ncbi:30S ribosomal protein S4 [candidate division TA06 bacterium]|nr:30S ribosomal protein S4 [candidate division TA06 bacterium]
MGTVCRLCRREGVKLFLKGERCNTEKCAVDRRAYPPGDRPKRFRRKPSGYSVQLREKQKTKRIYGIREKQFKNYFKKAERRPGITGEILLQYLERRLDNVVYHLGFAPSRKAARQLVNHGHFLVNEKKVNIPSYLLEKGDVIGVREKSQGLLVIQTTSEKKDEKTLPSWLLLEKNVWKGRVLELPARDAIGLPVEEKLIVELYSK